MKRREIERELQNELKRATPNVLDRVLAAPRTAPEPLAEEERARSLPAEGKPKKSRRRLVWASAVSFCLVAVIAVTGVLLARGRGEGGGAVIWNNGGSVYLDINPSVQFVLNGSGRVTAVTPLNEDAKVLLKNREKQLKGKSAEEAAALVVQYAGEQGYIRVDKRTNAVLVSATLEDAQSEKKLERQIGRSIEEQFQEKGIYGVVITDVKDEDMRAKAAALGVTESKMRLIENVRKLGVPLSDERARTISVADLYELIEEAAEELEDVLDDDVLEAKLEALNERMEEELEQLSERVSHLMEKLEEYLEDIGSEEQTEALEKALEALGEAFEGLTEGEGNAEQDLEFVQEKLLALQGIPLEDEALAEQVLKLTQGVDEGLSAYREIMARYEGAKSEAAALLVRQQQQLAGYQVGYNGHSKDKDYDKEYQKWLKEVKQRYEEDWDAMKQKWEREEDDD